MYTLNAIITFGAAIYSRQKSKREKKRIEGTHFIPSLKQRTLKIHLHTHLHTRRERERIAERIMRIQNEAPSHRTQCIH